MVQLRRRALIVAAGTLLIAPRSTLAQQPQKVWRIGVITTRARPALLESDFLGAWIPRLRELGYVEGRDFTVEWRFADGSNERLPDLAAELTRLKPDLVMAAGTPAARAMQKAGPHLTADSFNKALVAMGDLPADMFGSPPMRFTDTQRLGSAQSRLSQIQDGRWKVVSDLR